MDILLDPTERVIMWKLIITLGSRSWQNAYQIGKTI